MKLHHWLCALFLGVFASGAAHAADIIVTVLGSMAFTPTTVNINVGDTVTFKYAGGGLAHNVHADDNSFRCATSCSGNGANPTSAAWSATIQYNTAGTFRYYCDLHGAPGGVGMAGTVIVHPAAPTIALGGYMSGNWYNANQAGHGFQLELSGSNDMIAIWFVYTPDGSGQSWIYAQGPFDPTKNTVTLPAQILTGAKFPPNFVPGDVHQQGGTLWGNLTFTFTDCNNGTVSWHSDMAGYNNQNDTPLAITRLTQIAGTTCPQ